MADISRFPGEPGRQFRKEKKPGYVDLVLLFCVFVLVVMGLIMIYSTSAYEAGRQFGDVRYYLKKQIIAVGIGIVGMIATSFIPYKIYQKSCRTICVVAGASLLVLYTPLAYTANGATRWFRIMGVSVQPAEIVKIAMIIFMAWYLCKRLNEVDTIQGMIKAVIVPAVYVIAVFVITNNLSSAIIIAAIVATMIFVKSKNYKVFGLLLLAVIVIFAILVIVFKKQLSQGISAEGGFRSERFMAWLDPAAFATGKGYQTLQSLYAIGSGGIFGKGIGESVQKLGFIPEAQNDMIFAIICEELGFVGALFVVIVFGILITRCRYIALRVKDPFGGMIVVGVMAHIAIQVVLNIAVVTNTIPNTGISLPFISYGGTSVAFLMTEIGIVINIGKSIKVEQ